MSIWFNLTQVKDLNTEDLKLTKEVLTLVQDAQAKGKGTQKTVLNIGIKHRYTVGIWIFWNQDSILGNQDSILGNQDSILGWLGSL